MESWKHNDEWRVRGTNFLVSVQRHDHYEEGKHKWFIYAYIYPNHPLFVSFNEDEGIYQDATDNLPLHCGCSLLTFHANTYGEVLSVQVGADYLHLYDDDFERMESKKQATSIFDDAEQLFETLENMTKGTI